eukprot:TRINITY_DN39853_c0_g1_i1.p1 TRINITY_DN39853_c0_g1~~TRINITY_DN39853_c0_g1_i1.p1  ORF type:complete len:381 (-),score=26.67 TRINITY_DN39853_c0_g1_i1:30-1172(-)
MCSVSVRPRKKSHSCLGKVRRWEDLTRSLTRIARLRCRSQSPAARTSSFGRSPRSKQRSGKLLPRDLRARGLRRLDKLRSFSSVQRRRKRCLRTAMHAIPRIPDLCSTRAELSEWRDLFAELVSRLEARLASECHLDDTDGTVPACVASDQESESDAWVDWRSIGNESEVYDALDHSVAQRRPDEVLCTRFNAELTRRHFCCLVPEGWLNDEMVNCYFRLLQERGGGRYWCPNSFFWSRLEADGHASVRRWAQRAGVKVSELDAILLPLHLNGDHWALGVIDVQAGCLRYLDSLGLMPPGKLADRLREYAAAECGPASGWPLHVDKDVPRQQNCSDCGVFMCSFAERYAARARIKFPTHSAAIDEKRCHIAAAILGGRLP